jgi:hypothetical protein
MHSVEPCVDGGLLVRGNPVGLPVISAAKPNGVVAKLAPQRQSDQTADIRRASRQLASAIFSAIDSGMAEDNCSKGSRSKAGQLLLKIANRLGLG